MDVFDQAAEKIIKEQEGIIGPVALEQARKVSGITIDANNKVKLSGNKSAVVNSLVKQYQGLFGQTSVEVCKDAVKSLFTQSPNQLPSLLR